MQPQYPSDFSEDLIDLLNKILNKNPDERIPLSEVASHVWFN
jgi:serine/threonine protein kinase